MASCLYRIIRRLCGGRGREWDTIGIFIVVKEIDGGLIVVVVEVGVWIVVSVEGVVVGETKW